MVKYLWLITSCMLHNKVRYIVRIVQQHGFIANGHVQVEEIAYPTPVSPFNYIRRNVVAAPSSTRISTRSLASVMLSSQKNSKVTK